MKRGLVGVAAMLAGVVVGCFQSDFLSGLPCREDSECGSLKCENGFCGGRAETSDGSASEASQDDDGDSTTTNVVTTTGVDGSPTTLDTSADAEDDASSGTSEGGCPPVCPCVPPSHEPCDADANSLVLAFGLSCPGESSASSEQQGSVAGRTTRMQVGGFTAREGQRFAVLGSGLVNELGNEPPEGDLPQQPTFCSDDQGAAFDLEMLPPPLTAEAPAEECDNPDVVGQGLDCSGSLADEIVGSIEDYSSLTIGVTVPADVRSFSFDFAFSSVEYPGFVGGNFNDIFVAWLQSELWTGNVSFDGDDAISVNSDLLVIKDDAANDPLLAGTCLRGHASTGWLTTTAPVTPEEEIVVVFAVFDQVDSIVDSFVFLDGFRWNCSPVPRPETHS